MSRRNLSQALESIRVRAILPIMQRVRNTTRAGAETTSRMAAAVFVAAPRALLRGMAERMPKRAAAVQAAQPPLDPRAEEIERFYSAFREGDVQQTEMENTQETDASAAPTRPALLDRARNALRAQAAAARAWLVAQRQRLLARCEDAAQHLMRKARNPGQTAMEITAALRDGAALAGRRILRMRRMDATVAALFFVALLGPLAAPNLSDRATIALTRDNPLVARLGVTAERDLAISTPSTPTLWNGVRQASAERDIAPDWVLNAGVDLGPLAPAEALSRPARMVDVMPAPLWSPSLARQGVEDEQYSFEDIETATIPGQPRAATPFMRKALDGGEVAKLELGAFDTGPTAPAALASAAPSALGDDQLNAGDYATANVGAAIVSAWPAMDEGGENLPSSVVDALSLGDASQQELPLRSAKLPPIRPVLVGAKRTPRVTVVLTAIGINEAASRKAIQTLPSAIAMAIAPVAKNPSAWVDAAHGSSRTALLEIPMEPVTYPRVNPGPLTLLANGEAKANLERLAEALKKAPQVDGVASYLGSRFSSVRGAVSPVLAELKKRDLFMLETDPSPLSHLLRSAAEIEMPAMSSLVSLDKSGRSTDLSEGFARLEEIARVKGHAVGVAVAVPSSVEALEAWTRDLEKRGFRLSALPL